jgi:hypothetical protein
MTTTSYLYHVSGLWLVKGTVKILLGGTYYSLLYACALNVEFYVSKVFPLTGVFSQTCHSEMKLIFWKSYILSALLTIREIIEIRRIYRILFISQPYQLPPTIITNCAPYPNLSTPHPKVQCGYPCTIAAGELLEKRRTTCTCLISCKLYSVK